MASAASRATRILRIVKLLKPIFNVEIFLTKSSGKQDGAQVPQKSPANTKRADFQCGDLPDKELRQARRGAGPAKEPCQYQKSPFNPKRALPTPKEPYQPQKSPVNPKRAPLMANDPC